MDSTKKIWKIDQKSTKKNAQQGPPKRICKFYPLFSHPEPPKRENPSRLKDFRGGSAAPARPRVAKAMLSNHHRTASPDLRGYAPLPPTPGLGAASREQRSFRGSLLPNVAFWNQKKISRKAPGRWPKDMLLGRQGRRETFRGSLLPNVAFWNQKKISRKAPGRWPKDMLLGRQGRRETFRGSLLPNVAFWNQKKISRKTPGRWPKDMLLGRQGRRETFRGSLLPNVAGAPRASEDVYGQPTA